MAQLDLSGNPSQEDSMLSIIQSFGKRATKYACRKEALAKGLFTAHDLISLGEQMIEQKFERLMRRRVGKERMPMMIPTGTEAGQYVLYEFANEAELLHSINLRSKLQIGSDVMLKKMCADFETRFQWAPSIPKLTYDGPPITADSLADDINAEMDEEADLAEQGHLR